MPDRNPWLDIPASDYEGHMGHPDVAQLEFLARLLAELLHELRPSALAVPGSGMGTGFEHIEPAVTERVLAVDIQPDYLELLRRRHGGRLPGLEIVLADLSVFETEPDAYDLVFAALIFEYLEPEPLLGKLARWLRPGGTLCTVLQLPGEGRSPVSATPYESLRVLEPMMHLVDPVELRAQAAGAGLGLVEERVETLASVKEFHVARFIRMGNHDGKAGHIHDPLYTNNDVVE